MLRPWRNSKETVLRDRTSSGWHSRVQLDPCFRAVPVAWVWARERSPRMAGVFMGVGLARSLRPGQERESWGRSEQHS